MKQEKSEKDVDVYLAGYETARGTIRFDPKRPLPDSLVKKIVKARLEELRGG